MKNIFCKIISIVVTLCILSSCFPSVFATTCPFIDVPDDAWYKDSVEYVYANGLMNGVSATEFAPHETLTRAMAVTVLYRLDGEPEIKLDNPFSDVFVDSYYYNAVLWAYKNKIVNGTSATTFSPNDNISREQMVTFFYRYANYKELNTTSAADLSGYADYSDVSEYAKDAFRWSVAVGLVNGVSEDQLQPRGTATRAQYAAIQYRFKLLSEANKHTHSYVDEIVIPTCTKGGYTKHVCLECNDYYVDSEVPALGHEYSNWTVKKEPTTTEIGIKERVCNICNNIETQEIPAEDAEKNIVVHYKVVDGIVKDLVSGNIMDGATVDGEYFSGGKVVLPSKYEKATIETIMLYNRTSTDNPIGNGLSYYGGAFLFQEISNPSNWGQIKVPFGGGQIGTNFILNASLNYDKPVFGGGESYWCLAFDKEEGTYALQVNNNYVEKAHWSNYIAKTFTLSLEHKFKEFIVYDSRLSADEMAENFNESGIKLLSETTTTIGRVTDGIAGLGSGFAFSKTGTYGIPEWIETNSSVGNYSLNNGNGLTLDYTISNYVEPNKNVDNSIYDSVHIIKKPKSLSVDYKYALSAVPYPFNVNHSGKSDQYDVSWASSDTSVAMVIDGLVIPKKIGTVTITATLRGTEISDSCTIEIVKRDVEAEKILDISENYISDNGNRFSDEDYVMTTNAIYDAITEAYEAGYNHVVFPKIDFYAAPTGTEYYIPTGMTVEFPEGSTFHMMPSELAKNDGYTYFRMGWGWRSYNIPTERAYTKTDDNGNVLGYYCRDAHLIIDKYYGEFYKENATANELSIGANQYQWGCVLLHIGKRAEYCSVEVREANCPTGFFILMGGKGNNELIDAAGGTIAANKFVSGWLDDTGSIVKNENWISTPDFYSVSVGTTNGTDTLHEYYMGDWEHNVIESTQHLYDILWFDENYELIQTNRWQYVDEGYSNKPNGAKYFKISIQQSDLPTGTDFYIGLYPDESSRFCEIKNTKVINGADGLASVTGATEACWIHDNYVSGDGLLSDSYWALDLENGWQGMRGTIIEHNILRKYAYGTSHGEYRGMDSGVLALSSGYNTFVISNYLGSIAQTNWNVANTHIINNAIYTMYSSISGGKATDIRSKIAAHVYYNIIGDANILENTSSNGVTYHYGNSVDPSINKW